MKHLLTILLMALVLPLAAQNSKKVQNMNARKTQLQKDLKKSQKALDDNKAAVKKGQQNITYLDHEIEARVKYIKETQEELDTLNHRIAVVEAEIKYLDSVLTEKKAKYTRTLRLAQTFRKVQSPLLFALSADNVTQMYRRLRYTREYASYQRVLGEQVQQKQAEMMVKQNELLGLRTQANAKMNTLIEERRKLNKQQVEQRAIVDGLKKKQKGIQKEIGNKQKEIAALQKEIDRQVAREIEEARKRAEAEARKKAQAQGKKGATTSSGKAPAGSPSKWLTPEEQALNGTFTQNKGRLPVPITGQYMIGAHYGSNVSGTANVQLTNKGTNYVGRSGARARAIFDGEVSAVFSFGGQKNVLVRHGSYISVYCNLSSVIVTKGQKVKARDLLGTVASDGNGNFTLHFQLRKETSLLNPEAWIGR